MVERVILELTDRAEVISRAFSQRRMICTKSCKLLVMVFVNFAVKLLMLSLTTGLILFRVGSLCCCPPIAFLGRKPDGTLQVNEEKQGAANGAPDSVFLAINGLLCLLQRIFLERRGTRHSSFLAPINLHGLRLYNVMRCIHSRPLAIFLLARGCCCGAQGTGSLCMGHRMRLGLEFLLLVPSPGQHIDCPVFQGPVGGTTAGTNLRNGRVVHKEKRVHCKNKKKRLRLIKRAGPPRRETDEQRQKQPGSLSSIHNQDRILVLSAVPWHPTSGEWLARRTKISAYSLRSQEPRQQQCQRWPGGGDQTLLPVLEENPLKNR